MDSIAERVKYLMSVIEKGCMLSGLNITVYEGKIGFVDQSQSKIVALWEPQYTMNDAKGGEANGVCS